MIVTGKSQRWRAWAAHAGLWVLLAFTLFPLLAVISMAVPSAFSRAFAPEGMVREEQMLNIGIAVTLLLAYGLYLLFSLKTHPEAFASTTAGVEGEGQSCGCGCGVHGQNLHD